MYLTLTMETLTEFNQFFHWGLSNDEIDKTAPRAENVGLFINFFLRILRIDLSDKTFFRMQCNGWVSFHYLTFIDLSSN